jgi:hypothetical protein
MDFPPDDPNFMGKTTVPRVLTDSSGNYRFRFSYYPKKGVTATIEYRGYSNPSTALLEADMTGL